MNTSCPSVIYKDVAVVELDELTLLVSEQNRADRHPVIVRGADIGECCSRWCDGGGTQSYDYVKRRIGSTRVSVHVSSVPRLDFLTKNFVYRTSTVAELLDKCVHETSKSANEICKDSDYNEYYYMRSLALVNPRSKPANFFDDFLEISSDFKMPHFISVDRLFSSILRIASPKTQLWTHYDVMENALVQICGKKRVVLFSPLDVPNLYLQGDKSRVLDIDCPDLNQFPKLSKTVQHVANLEPGDLLYMPALWLHNVTAVESTNIAVNVFWKDLPESEYDTKDAYGNKDPVSFQRAQQGLLKAVSTIDKNLPYPYKQFYAHRLIDMIKQTLLSENDTDSK